MGKLFGTDGIRGIVGDGLDADLAYRVGRAAAMVLSEEKKGHTLFTIGKDTRISSDMLESALIAGLCASGADVLRLGCMPTPAVAYLTIVNGADAGIVISASHNPYEYNGIKIFNQEGIKLSDELEGRIEALLLDEKEFPAIDGSRLGRVIPAGKAEVTDYIAHLVSSIDSDLEGLKILVDCANGAASTTAANLFDHFALRAEVIHAAPDGININEKCGSTNLEELSRRVAEGDYDLGVAFDGDADRCLLVDEKGGILDGDKILAICGAAMQENGELSESTLVATVMSNLGLHQFAREHGMTLLCTNVGDRYVLEKMREGGFSIGGEQSGHMIFATHATTGDGQLTALQFLQVLHSARKKASELAATVPYYPQVIVNVPVQGKEEKASVMASQSLKDEIVRMEKLLGQNGRVLVRPSGTENIIRVMVEAKDDEQANFCANTIARAIK